MVRGRVAVDKHRRLEGRHDTICLKRIGLGDASMGGGGKGVVGAVSPMQASRLGGDGCCRLVCGRSRGIGYHDGEIMVASDVAEDTDALSLMWIGPAEGSVGRFPR